MSELQLSFHSVELELQFQRAWYQSSLRQIRWSMALALVLLITFSQLDTYYFPPVVVGQLLLFRWLVIVPLCVGILLATYFDVRGQYLFATMSATLSLMTWYFARLAPQLDAQIVSYLMPLLVQLALFQLVLLRIPFRMSLLASGFALLVTFNAFVSMQIPLHQRISILGGFGAIHIILLFNAYQRERAQRSLFMSEQQLRQSLRDRVQIQDERSNWYQNLARFLRHELSNQLVGARTSLQLIERFEDRRAEYIGRARQSLDRMQLMLNETSDATSIEEALKSEEREAFDLSLLVSDCAADYTNQYPEHYFDVQMTDGVHMVGQPFRMAQLLDKLVSNAVRHTLGHAPIGICLRCCEDGRVAELVVVNRGEPLPADIDALFSLWATSASYSDEHRLGLGLYVAARVAEAHGGSIRAEPLLGPDGARFVVSLPIWPQT